MSGVCFQARLALDWVADCTVSSWEAGRYLTVLAELESFSEERKLEYAELNAKLDLTLIWLARFLKAESHPTVAATLRLEEIVWQNTAAQRIGARGAVAINLSEALPFVVQLPARITACEAHEVGWQISAALEIEDEVLRDQWERTVFRRHRRAIQQQREAQA